MKIYACIDNIHIEVITFRSFSSRLLPATETRNSLLVRISSHSHLPDDCSVGELTAAGVSSIQHITRRFLPD
jgi:hypothetical protein